MVAEFEIIVKEVNYPQEQIAQTELIIQGLNFNLEQPFWKRGVQFQIQKRRPRSIASHVAPN